MMWPFYLAVWFFSALGLYCIARWYIIKVDKSPYSRADRVGNILCSATIGVWLLLAFLVFCKEYNWEKDAKW